MLKPNPKTSIQKYPIFFSVDITFLALMFQIFTCTLMKINLHMPIRMTLFACLAWLLALRLNGRL